MALPRRVKKIGKMARGASFRVGAGVRKLSKTPEMKMVQAPIWAIKKIIERPEEKKVETIEIFDLKKLLSGACQNVVLHQEEINKINVFPVADKDTGYNLAATLLGIEGAIADREYKNRIKFIKDIREATMMNARGNAGMITAGFLLGFLDSIKFRKHIDSILLAKAMKKGKSRAWQSIEKPVEGTILDVMNASSDKSWEIRRKEKNIIKILEECIKVGKSALAETKEKLEVLKRHDVVDAGGLGFLKILEGWLIVLKEGALQEEKTFFSSAFASDDIEISEYRYCLTAFSGKKIRTEEIRNKISGLGGSVEFLESNPGIKFHIHTNFPEKIKERVEKIEKFSFNIEDMEKQFLTVKKKPVGLVVGETAVLPKDFLKKYQIEEVPFPINFPEGEKISGKNLYEKMRKAKILPTTAASPFGNYLVCYKKALKNFEKILVITPSCKISASYAQARIARAILRRVKKNIFAFDCFLVDAGEGIMAARSQELINRGKTLEEILEELKRFSPQVRFLLMVEDLKFLIKGGRLKVPLFMIPVFSFLGKTGIRPLITLKEGKLKFASIKFGVKDAAKCLIKEIKKQSRSNPVRAVITHADNEKSALALKEEIEKEGGEVLYVSSVSTAVGVHAGPGTLIVAFHPIQ